MVSLLPPEPSGHILKEKVRNRRGEMGIAVAKGRYLPMSARKIRLVVNLIRGMYVGEALSVLKFVSKQKAARLTEKVLNSAIANAKSKFPNVDVDNLYIQEIYVDEGPMYKRLRPGFRGVPRRIRKKTSHLTIVLDERR